MTTYETLTTDVTTRAPRDNTDTNDLIEIPGHVADAEFDRDVRIIILWVQVVVGTIGGMFVCSWLWYNRRRKSRVNAVILQVALSDLFVILCACLPQLIWEYFDRHWSIGDVLCKMCKYMQSLVLIASSYMLVVLSIDRHQAIRAPLREPFAVWKMTLVAWTLSGLISLPMLIVFHVNTVEAPGIFQNKTVCEPNFRHRPHGERQAFLTFISIVVFYIPFFILVVCYVRIFLKIAEKANESKSGKKQTIKPGKVHLQSTPSSSLPKAKVKTLKMALVIVIAFIVCGLPYHILEAVYSYGNFGQIPGLVASIMGGMASANSAANPYVFLLFNANLKCARGFVSSVFPCGSKSRSGRAYFESTASTRSEYTLNRTEYTLNTDITRTVAKYSPTTADTGAMEMTIKNKTANSAGTKKASYTLLTTTHVGEGVGNSAANV